MPRCAVTGEAGRVWSFLRCDRACRAQWRDRPAPPEYEDGPFPVRIRSRADLEAAESWRMLA